MKSDLPISVSLRGKAAGETYSCPPLSHKRVAILGSTGSIGCNAVEVIEHLGAPYRVSALSANARVDPLVQQARRCRPAPTGSD